MKYNTFSFVAVLQHNVVLKLVLIILIGEGNLYKLSSSSRKL
jgi:hypothetical protein